MNIKRAKEEIEHTVKAYLAKDTMGEYAIPSIRQRPILLMGPPGIGKTQIMEQAARECGVALVAYTITHHTRQSAVGLPFIRQRHYGDKDVSVTEYTMSEIISSVYAKMEATGLKEGILFIDEIHRFSKSQQDSLLGAVEQGTVTLIGATTENPSFEVIRPLLSRCQLYTLKSLEKDDLLELLQRAITTDTVLKERKIELKETTAMLRFSGGDARKLLNILELVIDSEATDPVLITDDMVTERLQQNPLAYDKDGEMHYDIISAFIKSMRGSDPDAAVYYLAKMLYAGEDVKFIARRIMILASEDIGNADPQALCVAVAAAQAVERVGMPESQIILSQAVTYMACAPKSNSAVNAIFAAMDSVKRTKTTVPPHLQDAHYGGHEKLGHGIGYEYAHDYPNHYVHQQYLPTEIQGEHFYELSEMGYEKTLKEYQNKIKSQS